MNKSAFNTGMLRKWLPPKILLIMKLIVVILTTCLMQVSASGFAQRLTYVKKNVSLEQVFQEINKQTGYEVLYSNQILNDGKRINADFNNTALDDVLKGLLKGQPLSYEINQKTILIKEKEQTFLEQVVARFQAIDVKGKVVDSLGNGLAGATVSVKNGKASTSTDAAGNFLIRNVDESATLVVSYLGFITKEVTINREFTYIELKQSASKLDEVQVIAYGVTTRRLSTGNVTTVKAEDIAKQPVNNPLYALQGKVAGLQVTPFTGLAGGAVTLKIRGNNSLSSGSEPLIIVNGLPIPNNITGLGHGGFLSANGTQFSSLNFLDPNQIESISILKDADATSIYGSRGANGVIVITTKKGGAGRSIVNINAQSGFSDVPKQIKLMNTADYLTMRKEAYFNSGIDLSTVSKSKFNADVTLWEQNRYTNWQNELLGNKARYHDVQGSISGGAENIQYNVGGTFHKENTVFDNVHSDQKASTYLTLSGNSANNKLKMLLSVSYMLNNNTLPSRDLTEAALTLPPNAPTIFNDDGSLNWRPLLPNGNTSWDNPHASVYNEYRQKVYNLLSSSTLSYALLNNLQIEAVLGYNRLNGTAFFNNDPLKGRPPESLYADFSSTSTETGVQNINFEPKINYKKVSGNNRIVALLGGSIQNTKSESENLDAYGFKSEALIHNLSAASSYILRNNETEYRYAAIFGRLNYNYADKYILDLTARRDGSSRFGPGRQFGHFGSIGTAWIFSKEKFFEKLPQLSFGKFRLSYGTSGNDGVGDYVYLEQYGVIDASDPYQGAVGYGTYGIFNSKYAWEITKKLELGVETGFFSDRVFLNASFYRNRSGNQLINSEYPSMAGIGGGIINFPALVQNAGMEFELTTRNIERSQFKWSSTINITFNRNKLVSFPEIENTVYNNRMEINKPFYGTTYAFESAGVNPETGAYQFFKSDGSITANPIDFSRLDYGQYLRLNSLSQYYGGVVNNISYKGFSLDFTFQFTKQKGINPLRGYLEIAGTQRNLPVEFNDRWQKAGDNKTFQKIFTNLPPEYFDAAINKLGSDFALVDASFLRLKNFSISYKIPPSLLNKLKVNELKLYVHGQNLFTITNYKGLDPETQSMRSLPPLRVFSAGFQLSL